MTQVALAPARKRVATRRMPASVAPAMAVEPKPEPKKAAKLDDGVTEFTLERDTPVVYFGDTYELKLGGVTMGFLEINGKSLPMTHVQAEPRTGKAPQTWIMKIPGYVTFRLSESKSGVLFRVLRNPNGDVSAPAP